MTTIPLDIELHITTGRGPRGPGGTWKDSARAASTSNLTLTGEQTVDGVALAEGDRVLVKDQNTASENGIYTVGSQWSRAVDANTASRLVCASTIRIEEGVENAGTSWSISTPNPIVIGTTAITFEATSAVAQGGVRVASGTSDTLVIDDAGGVVMRTNAAASTSTVPPVSDVAFDIGDSVRWVHAGAGSLAFVAGSGVSLNVVATKSLASLGQGAVIHGLMTSADNWYLYGDLTAAVTIPTTGLIEHFDPSTVALGTVSSITSSVSASVLTTSSAEPWATGTPAGIAPILTAGEIGSRNALLFDRKVLRGAIGQLGSAAPFTLFLIVRSDIDIDAEENQVISLAGFQGADGSYCRLYLEYLRDAAGGYVIDGDGNYPRVLQLFFANSAGTQICAVFGGLLGAFDTGVDHIIAITFASASAVIHIDGDVDTMLVKPGGSGFVAAPASHNITWTGNVFDIGVASYVSAGSRYGFLVPGSAFENAFSGAIGDVAIYDGALDDTERGAVEAALATIWGIAIP